MTKKPIAIAAIAALAAAAPAAAHDHGSKRAKVSRAQLAATEAAATAGIPDVRGKAQLVDGRKRDKVSLHVRGLKAGDTYLWDVRRATGAGDPCAKDSAVAATAASEGWTYRSLKANEAGNANSKGTSTTFPVAAPVQPAPTDPAPATTSAPAPAPTAGRFYVTVQLQDGTPVACGVLRGKAGKPDKTPRAEKGHGKGGHERPEHAERHGR
jgi:hypothetical protein